MKEYLVTIDMSWELGLDSNVFVETIRAPTAKLAKEKAIRRLLRSAKISVEREVVE